MEPVFSVELDSHPRGHGHNSIIALQFIQHNYIVPSLRTS